MNAASSRRLGSVDALRGITVAAMLLVNDPGDWGHVYWPLDHSVWNGCTPTDLIFPFFLFIVGVSISLSILPRLQRGDAPASLLHAAWWRALRIVALGLAINALAAWLLPDRHMRWPGVLQRIGVCFALAAPLAIYCRPRIWWLTIGAILAGYTALLLAGGTLDPYVNIVSRVDFAVFGHGVWSIDPVSGRGHDPEGLLSTLPALATTLLGLCAGVSMRQQQMRRLVLAGVIALVLGAAWSLWIPFNKNLWTPSFVLWCAGWSAVALALCHWLIDQCGWPAWGRRFGINAIAAYGGSELLQVLLPGLGWQDPLYHTLVANWATPLVGPWAASLIWAIAFVIVWWLIVWWLDRRRLYLKL
ncbi:MAG TPA: heparan-alpha-glucosaminide N-acetyltransferase domain-containing protein [Rhodanobacteraceae bacterium]|nr:heparan-alpha-glucosaminide N-acetyltransferase domain-containing protein [Rhodanobacteraceae bacterium]